VSSLDGMGDAIDALNPGEKDLIIFMGAGAIDAEARKIVKSAVSLPVKP
jgi:hypothetical protein